MNRRRLLQQPLALAALWPLACVRAQPGPIPWQEIEGSVGGRLGVAVLDTADGRLEGHRLDERFPMCSTFKSLLAACVLQRVDQGHERLDRRIRYGRDALVSNSPTTSRHVGGDGLRVDELCEATLTLSDNAAANLLLASLGGPPAVTRYVRTLGDTVTRLDRPEPALNESAPDDERDTTTPRAMAQDLRALLLGEALAPASRELLVRWMEDCRTDAQRLRAALPAGWRLASKTGTGERGSTHDVGVFWPPGRPAIVVAAYLAATTAPADDRNAAIARVARRVTSAR